MHQNVRGCVLFSRCLGLVIFLCFHKQPPWNKIHYKNDPIKPIAMLMSENFYKKPAVCLITGEIVCLVEDQEKNVLLSNWWALILLIAMSPVLFSLFPWLGENSKWTFYRMFWCAFLLYWYYFWLHVIFLTLLFSLTFLTFCLSVIYVFFCLCTPLKHFEFFYKRG